VIDKTLLPAECPHHTPAAFVHEARVTEPAVFSADAGGSVCRGYPGGRALSFKLNVKPALVGSPAVESLHEAVVAGISLADAANPRSHGVT
jgi:hypothetical protein